MHFYEACMIASALWAKRVNGEFMCFAPLFPRYEPAPEPGVPGGPLPFMP